MARKLPSLLTFVVGVALVGVGSVCIVLRPPLGLFILLFGVVFLVIGGLTLLFHASGVKLRAHHVIENAVGLLFILFADYLVFSDSPAVPMTLVTGMVFLVLGWFPWAYKLPSYVALAIGGTLLAAACLAGVYVPLIIGRGFVDGETTGFLIHLINFTLGVPGIVLILAGVARFFRWLLFKTSTQLESADGSKSLLKPKRRWFQFSLQKFLLVVTLFAYGLGWLVIWFDEPEARRLGYSTSVVNGRIYVMGGMGPLGPRGQVHGLSTVEEYYPATDTWTRKADMPTPGSRPSTCAVNGKIYVIGYSTVEEYDPVTDEWTKWTRKGDIPTGGVLSTTVVNEKIYVVIMRGDGVGGLSTVEEYDPGMDK